MTDTRGILWLKDIGLNSVVYNLDLGLAEIRMHGRDAITLNEDEAEQLVHTLTTFLHELDQFRR